MSHTSSSDSFYELDSCRSASSVSIIDSDMSFTPSRRGMAGVTKPILDNVKPHSREDVNNTLFSGALIEDFAKHVWGIDPEDIELIKSSFGKDSNPLDRESFDRYQFLCNDPSNEKYLYDPFQRLAEALVRDLLKLGVYRNKVGQFAMKNLLAQRKPDMLLIHKNATIPTWMATLLSVEFKKKTRKNESSTDQTLEGELMGPSSSTSMATSGSAKPVVKSKKATAKGRRRSRISSNSRTIPLSSDAVPTVDIGKSGSGEGVNLSATRIFGPQVRESPNYSATPSHPASSGNASNASKKHKHAEDDSGPASKRLKRSVITNDYLQLATYARDVSTRHFATGIFIDKFTISLWYYDRACIICSQTFDFREAPELLALVVFANSTCDSLYAGLDPHLKADPLILSPSIDRPLSTMIGAHLEFSEMKPRINEALFEYRGLVGRGTMVYDVTQCFSDGWFVENQAMKLSWPLIVRPLEATTIEVLHAKEDHLPELNFSSTFTLKDLNFSHVELMKGRANCGELEHRQHHVLLMKEYKKLWEVGSVANFKVAFVDCVECHYHAHTMGKTLHCDLSENDLMFHRRDNKIFGVLNDWDMASLLDDTGEIPTTAARHRTGTIPFMAIDLLEPNPPTHMYRHDLESFLYILVWAAMTYDLGCGERCPAHIRIARWDGSFEDSSSYKGNFILDSTVSRKILAQARPEFQGLVKEWIEPLVHLFRRGRNTHAAPETAPIQPYDSATYGGYLTFHTFMEALGRTPRHLPDAQAMMK